MLNFLRHSKKLEKFTKKLNKLGGKNRWQKRKEEDQRKSKVKRKRDSNLFFMFSTLTGYKKLEGGKNNGKKIHKK